MARPKAEIDAEEVKKLAGLMCTVEEIAAWFDVDKSTISRRFTTEIAKGREIGKISLRRSQFQAVRKGNVTMMIWLGKQYLNQSEKVEVSNELIIKEELEFVGVPKGGNGGRKQYGRYYN